MGAAKTPAGIVADFDAIAAALERSLARDTLTSAERALLAQVPEGARRAIEVGCGDGVFTRALARRGLDVLGVDVSPRMIALARARTPAALSVHYRVADVMEGPLASDTYDVVVSVNVVHHFRIEEIIPRLAHLVAPGGRLLVQDLVERAHARYIIVNAAAVIHRVADTAHGRSREPRTLRALYAKHGERESYLTPDRVAAEYASVLPGARAYHHLEWRYSVVWERAAPTV